MKAGSSSARSKARRVRRHEQLGDVEVPQAVGLRGRERGIEVRRDHRHSMHAMIQNAARIDRRDRSAVGMSNQKAAAKTDLVEQLRQDLERLNMHVIERARQRDLCRGAITRARIYKQAGPGRGGNPVRKISPQRGTAQALVQQDDGRRFVRRGTHHAVFEVGRADADEAGGV